MSTRKKQQKRFFTKDHIIREIDAQKEKHRVLLERAEGLDLNADELLKHADTAEDGKYKRMEANKTRRSAMRILEKKLPYLRMKLAEFQTMKLPGMDDGDQSIPQ